MPSDRPPLLLEQKAGRHCDNSLEPIAFPQPLARLWRPFEKVVAMRVRASVRLGRVLSRRRLAELTMEKRQSSLTQSRKN
jgi:hypothetical protein